MRLRQTLAALSLAATTVTVPAVAAMSGTAGAAAPETAGVHIVLFEDSVTNPAAVAAEHAKRYGAQVEAVYSHAVKGYAASFKGTGAADVAHDRRVALVERDQVVTVESVASWGLDRIDQVPRGLDGIYDAAHTGDGVTAYIIDSGIQTAHQDFQGRASVGIDTVGDGKNGQDCNGHGTHVAGTVGGNTFGVAPGVDLVAVRVLGCGGSGSWSGVVAGIDWVAGNHQTLGTPAVANMSLGGGASTIVDTAVKNAIGKGVSFAVAAGNGNAGGVAQDACKSSPARVPDAMTIGATDVNDKKASWSNYGKCVDWFAPGVGITSAWTGSSNAATNTISGTSMATPHTAGVAALYLETAPGATPLMVRTALFNSTLQGIVTSAKTTFNHLLNIGAL